MEEKYRKRLCDLENKVDHMWFVPGMLCFLEEEQNFIKETQKTLIYPNISGYIRVSYIQSRFVVIYSRTTRTITWYITNIDQKYIISFVWILLEPPTPKRINLLRVLHMIEAKYPKT